MTNPDPRAEAERLAAKLEAEAADWHVGLVVLEAAQFLRALAAPPSPPDRSTGTVEPERLRLIEAAARALCAAEDRLNGDVDLGNGVSASLAFAEGVAAETVALDAVDDAWANLRAVLSAAPQTEETTHG